jgi:hypothetical protein
VLATQAGCSLGSGSQIALVDKGGTVSAWRKAEAGSEYTPLLSASDSTWKNGHAGLEASSYWLRLRNFQSGPLAPF